MKQSLITSGLRVWVMSVLAAIAFAPAMGQDNMATASPTSMSPNTDTLMPSDEHTYYQRDYLDNPNVHIYTSNIDWNPLAMQITAGTANNYQRIRAIYKWVCDNIDYDTTYSIFRADSCYLMRRGVCQAYCELFYQLAKAVGVRVELIGGYSKDINGFVSGSGHMWLFAFTDEKRGIFLDPTWGAGILQDHKFVRNTNIWTWFNVEPEWLILSHIPDNESYQMITPVMTMEEFRSLPVARPLWREYGLDVCEILQAARSHTLSLPTFYNGGEEEFEIVDIPRQDSLKIGETYTFRIRMKSSRELAVINNSVYCHMPEWKSEDNGVYAVDFMVRDTDRLHISLKDKIRTNYWNHMLSYNVAAPTDADWAKVEQHYPMDGPTAKRVKHLTATAIDGWRLAGINDFMMLKTIKQHHISELPLIYHAQGQRLQIIDVPMNGKLQTGNTYTFTFRPQSGHEWAIVNGNDWYKEFKVTDGIYTISVTPKNAGSLGLYVALKGNAFLTCLEYEVSR